MNLILSRTPSMYMYTYHAYTRAQNAEIAANIQCFFFYILANQNQDQKLIYEFLKFLSIKVQNHKSGTCLL